ncbi:MAG TPA: hypothetical protein VJS64_09415 [Pyrinomonadaceae bacterium]|nr:hypothetical protein [Pyrinomonadaceae bacterium]
MKRLVMRHGVVKAEEVLVNVAVRDVDLPVDASIAQAQSALAAELLKAIAAERLQMVA